MSDKPPRPHPLAFAPGGILGLGAMGGFMALIIVLNDRAKRNGTLGKER